MTELPDVQGLEPKVHTLSNGRRLFCFTSDTTPLVKLDFLFEAGSAYQPMRLCTLAANTLHTAASTNRDAAQTAEFFDRRGVIVDTCPDVLQCSTTFYSLRRHVDSILPVVDDLVRRPAFPEREFKVFVEKRRQKIQSIALKSPDMARRIFYQSLFGPDHPLGAYAVPDDASRLSLEAVRSFYFDRFRPSQMDIVVAGNVDDDLLRGIDDLFGHDTPGSAAADDYPRHTLSAPATPYAMSSSLSIPSSSQVSLRVGRVVPLRWDDPRYADLQLLVTVLGGYFGSRLMQNIREDKGYTYGVYARTQLYRGVTVLYIAADVRADAATAARDEIMNELRALCDNPVPVEELDMVKMVLAGDFLRSVDGIFERSSRFCEMRASDITETFTANLRHSLATATPDRLQALARQLFDPATMVCCQAGKTE